MENIKKILSSDLALILNHGKLSNNFISINNIEESQLEKNYCLIYYNNDNIIIDIFYYDFNEIIPIFYFALFNIGFLFSHPKRQITPNSFNTGTFEWKPKFKNRGFHIHTQHPNEWIDGFFLDKIDIATDLIRWLARNQQNILQIVLLKTIDLDDFNNKLAIIYKLASDFNIKISLDISFEMIQQHSYHLIKNSYLLNILSYFSKSYINKLKCDQIEKSINELLIK
jgi:hypothetical protein